MSTQEEELDGRRELRILYLEARIEFLQSENRQLRDRLRSLEISAELGRELNKLSKQEE